VVFWPSQMARGNARVTEMHPTSTNLGTDAPPMRRRKRRARARLDRRSRGARDVAKLVSELCQQIGDAAKSPLILADVERCAELTVLAATARASAMRGGSFDAESISKLEGAADRARRRLSAVPKVSDEPDLKTYLRQLRRTQSRERCARQR
jgi:hypothetical protein